MMSFDCTDIRYWEAADSGAECIVADSSVSCRIQWLVPVEAEHRHVCGKVVKKIHVHLLNSGLKKRYVYTHINLTAG